MSSHPFVDACQAIAPRLGTRVSLWRDEAALFALFACEDDGIVATYSDRDDPVWKEDAVEIFLAPGDPSEYFEIESSPRGTIFDARVVSPDGARETMRVDSAWDCEGLLAAIRIEPARQTEVLIRVPFKGLGRTSPRPGERWLANFYRIDRSEEFGDQYTAWRPTMKSPADFHVPAAFGEIVFP